MIKTYRPNDARSLSEKELRSEYSRLRRAANRRLANMEKRDLGTWGSNRFASARGMSADYVEAALLEVSRFLRDPRHTVRGEQEHVDSVLKTLNERGIDFIDRTNFYRFTDFMNQLRGQYSEKLFDSGDALEVFGNMERLGIDKQTVLDNYEFFSKNADKMSRLRVPRSSAGASYSAIRKKIGRLK